MTPKVMIGLVNRFASRLRFPQLFLFTAALFALDVVVPDFIPFADEILLALGTILLGSWKDHRGVDTKSQDPLEPGARPKPQSGR